MIHSKKNLLPFPLPMGSQAFILAAWSSILALLFSGLAGLPLFMVPAVPEARWLRFSLFILDPYALHALAYLHCCFCLVCWKARKDKEVLATWKEVLGPVVILTGLVLIGYVINDIVFKPSLDRPRPLEELRLNLGFMTQYVPGKTGGAPSGFAFRGIFLLLVSILAGQAIKQRQRGWGRLVTDVKAISVVQLTLLTTSCLARVLSGYHFWFDILLGLSLGTHVFWMMVFVLYKVSGRVGPDDLDVLTPLVLSILICFGITGLFYSREATAWAPSLLVATLAAMYIHYGPRRKWRQRTR